MSSRSDQDNREQTPDAPEDDSLHPLFGNAPSTVAQHLARLPSQGAPAVNQLPSSDELQDYNQPQTIYIPLDVDLRHYHAMDGQPAGPVPPTSDASTSQQSYWVNHATRPHFPLPLYEAAGNVTDPQHPSRPPYYDRPLSLPGQRPEDWQHEENLARSGQRLTITHRDGAVNDTPISSPNPSTSAHRHPHRGRGPSGSSLHDSDPHRPTHRSNPSWNLGMHQWESYGPGNYRGRELNSSIPLAHPVNPSSSLHGPTHLFPSISSLGSDYAGPNPIQDGINVGQPMLRRGSSLPPHRASSSSHARRAHSPRNELASDYSGSSANTPAHTEGSADPAQSDGEDAESRASASTSPVSPSSPTSTTSRWASFQTPSDIFVNDPARHALYHSIRHENWFVNQDYERSITGAESAQIPGTVPGDSVLLAFYTKALDGRGKTVMLCMICAPKKQKSTPYTRPDRAKVHIRHHFELRPVACTGKCKNTQCTQRFFTKNDLDAHVTGRTDPSVPCIYCNRPLLAKNRHRHITLYCPAAPEEIMNKRP